MYQHRLRIIEFGGLWLLLMSVAPSCSKEHFAPTYFVKGQHMAICAHICTTYHCVGHNLNSLQESTCHVIHSVHMQVVSKKIASRHYLVLRDISEWQIDKNLARQGWWEIHFHCQIGISPGSRVLNELSLAYDEERDPQPAWHWAVNWRTGRERWGRAMQCRAFYASTCYYLSLTLFL